MAEELSLVLNKPIEDLIPMMISWNNEELLSTVNTRLSSYKGIQYTDEEISIAKKDKAQLKAFVKALNDERIKIHKTYSAPYEKFKKEVDEVLYAVNEVVAEIDVQVKNYDERTKAKKLEKIKDYFNSAIGEFENLVSYEQIHVPAWLNASTTMKSIQTDIDSLISLIKSSVVAIEALKSPDESTIKAYYFRTLNLSDALVESERLKAEREKIEKMQGEIKVEKKESPVQVPEANSPDIRIIKFQVEGTIEQFKSLKEFLKSNNIKYSAI